MKKQLLISGFLILSFFPGTAQQAEKSSKTVVMFGNSITNHGKWEEVLGKSSACKYHADWKHANELGKQRVVFSIAHECNVYDAWRLA